MILNKWHVFYVIPALEPAIKKDGLSSKINILSNFYNDQKFIFLIKIKHPNCLLNYLCSSFKIMTIIRTSFFLFFLCVFRTFSFAQTPVTDTGKIELVQDQRIRELLDKQVEINSKANIKGYRIKIHSGTDKARAKEVKAKFIARFASVPAYEKYDQPNFNIRVGDFRTKLEAYKFLKEVQTEFPAAFIVVDDIEFPDLDTPVPADKK
ncbi:MAG: hypothetical protein JWP12_2137 [Bacteroidetes bacterium]|nr:hypothetical protein [Bacteroidota bacterium]